MLWLASAGMAAMAGVIGCTQTNDPSWPPADQLSNGLTVLESARGWGMNAAYKDQGRVIYFDDSCRTAEARDPGNGPGRRPAERDRCSLRRFPDSGRWVQYASYTGQEGSSGDSDTSIHGGCAIPYSWASGGHDHLCNDDSAYELWQAKSGNIGSNAVNNAGTNTAGGDLTFRWLGSSSKSGSTYFACNCSSFNGCNNDWGSPNCP